MVSNFNIKSVYSLLVPFRSISTARVGLCARTCSSFKGTTVRPIPTTSTGSSTRNIKWTDEQSQVLAAVANKKSVFVTGSAGTGKTMLVKRLIELLKGIHGPSKVFVTAPTGVAACAIEGQTLHSFSGIGYGAADRDTLLHMVVSNRRACKRWRKVKALVIDEISMVHASFFDSLCYIAAEVRGKKRKRKAWGGIQLIVSGDFFQLPPICDGGSLTTKEFAFEADCWDSSFDLQVELTQVFRQVDAQLVRLLQGIRRGESNMQDLQLLEQCSSKTKLDPSVVRLFPRNEETEKVNKVHLMELGMPIVSYNAIDSGSRLGMLRINQGLALDKLEVCLGARVMLIWNINVSLKLVNGSCGTIVKFVKSKKSEVKDMCDHGALPVVQFDSGLKAVVDPETWEVMEGDIVLARRTQIPLVLAWAFSIHKCQGMTLDSLHTDLSRAFGCGMVYVVLSRVRSFAGLHLSGFNPSKIKAHPKVLQFYKGFFREQVGVDESNGPTEVESCQRDYQDFVENTSLNDLHVSNLKRLEVEGNPKFLKQSHQDVFSEIGEGVNQFRTHNRKVPDIWEDSNNDGTKYYLTSENFLDSCRKPV